MIFQSSNLSTTITADGDGTYTLNFTGTVTDASGMGYVQFEFQNESGNTIAWEQELLMEVETSPWLIPWRSRAQELIL